MEARTGAALCGLFVLLFSPDAAAFSPAAIRAPLALRAQARSAGSLCSLRASAGDVSRRGLIAAGVAAAAVTLAPLEASAQRTLTKQPVAKKGAAPVEDDEEEDSEGAAKPAKGKTFATGRKTDDNAGATVAGVLVGSVVISLPFYWANVKRFVGKYTDIFKATTGLSDGDESRAAKQNEDM